jgi:hypothetical protein
MEILGIYTLIAFLIYAAGIIVIVMFIFAVWHVMKAQVRLAASVERMAESVEKIEETIRQNQTGV